MIWVNGPRAASILFDVAASQEKPQAGALMPANVCPIVPLTMLKAGRRLEFVDICTQSLAMNTEMALERIAAMPPGSLLIYVHTYGALQDVRSFFARAKDRCPDLLIVDDRCAARPEIAAAHTATGADVTLFSSGYGKYVDLGWGGYALIDDRLALRRHRGSYSAKALSHLTHSYQRLIRNQTAAGLKDLCQQALGAPWLDLSSPRANPEAHLAILAAKLDDADTHKEVINTIYRNLLPTGMQRNTQFHDWRFQVTVRDKQSCINQLFERGLFASDHYFPASQLFNADHCPIAEAQHQSSLNLFNDFNITQAQARQVAAIVRDYEPVK